MNNKTFDIKEALLVGWDTLRANVAFFLKLLVVMIVVAIIPAMIISKIAASTGTYLALPLQFLNFIWQSIIGMGFLKICLKFLDQQVPEISDLWSCIPRALDYVVVKFVIALIVAVGLVLLIIPGLIWAVQFYMASYLVVDKGAGAIAAIKGSSAITNGAKWDLGIFLSVLLLINFIGAVFLGVGLLITLPLTLLASLHVYRKLLAQTEGLAL